jgi:hypothetical protein
MKSDSARLSAALKYSSFYHGNSYSSFLRNKYEFKS